MTETLTCPGCGETSEVPDPVDASLYTCDDCGARVAHGVHVPTFRVLPVEGDAPRRFVMVRFDHPKASGDLVVDRALGAMLARDLLSVCAPEAYAAFSKSCAAAERPAPSSPEGEPSPDSSGAHVAPPVVALG